MRTGFASIKKAVGLTLVALIAATGICPLSLAQDKTPQKDSGGKSAKKDPNTSKKKEELKSVYKRWLEEDVTYIITEDERRAFKALKTDEERDQFIENFWLRRDPDPDTPDNEYKEEYYERIQYANEHFASGVPGWKTDRGRIYIMFGKPDEKEEHPTGGAYDRPYYEGGGTTSTYPFETWWYRFIEGVGSDIEIEFVDPSGTGEYHIATNPNEKDALLYMPGAGLTLSEQLGLSDKGERMTVGPFGSYTGTNTELQPMRAKDNPFEKLQQYVDLQRPPAIKFPDLKVKADLPEVATDILPFSIRTDFFRISETQVVTAFTVQFEHKDLSFKNDGGIYSSQVNMFAKIDSIGGRRSGSFEDIVSTGRYTQDQLPMGEKQKSVYQKKVVMNPGRFKIDIVAKDIVSGKTGIIHHSFEVPRYKEKELSTSTLILASSIEMVDSKTMVQGDPSVFIIGRYKVTPFVSGIYKPGQNLALFLQVYDAEMDQATLQPALKVEYSVLRGDKEIISFVEDGKNPRVGVMDLKGQQLVIARAIPIQGDLTQPGDYTVKVKITDLVSQKVVTPQAVFRVIKP